MKPVFRIREAVLDDLPALAKLQVKWAAENSVYGFVPQNEKALKRSLGPLFLVGTLDGVVVGYAVGKIRSCARNAVIPAAARIFELDEVYVVTRHRSRGIGGRLIRRILAKAKKLRATNALLYSSAKNSRSIMQFYERHGFKTWYVQMFKQL